MNLTNKSCFYCKHYCHLDPDDDYCNKHCCITYLDSSCSDFEIQEKEYHIRLTKIEIKKIIGLIEVVIQPLRKAAKNQIIPKHKGEAEQTLSEVEFIINKLKKEISNDD